MSRKNRNRQNYQTPASNGGFQGGRVTTPKSDNIPFGPQELAYFKRLGIVVDKNGLPQMTEATPTLLQVERLRQSQVTRQRIPSAPKYLWPDAMGQGVTRNAWGEPLTDRHLRQYGRKSPIAVKARYACVSQVSSGCGLLLGTKHTQDGSQAGVRVVHKDWSRDEAAPQGFDKYIRRAEQLLDTPFDGDSFSPAVLSLQQLIQGLYGDVFDLNRGVLEPIWRGNECIGVRPADGGIIIPAWETVQKWCGHYDTTIVGKVDLGTLDPQSQRELVSQDIRNRMVNAGYGDPNVDLTDPETEWVVYRDGIVDGSFKRGELIVLPMLTSTDIEYAGHMPSYLQLGMEFVAMSWTIHDFQGRKFTDGAWTSMILALIGEGYDDEGFTNFLNDYREGAKGYQRANKPHMVHLADGGDLKAIDTRPPVTDAEFVRLSEIVENGFCAIIRRHPEIVNGSISQAGGGSRLNGPSEDLRIRISKEEGQVTDVRHMAAYLTKFVRMAVHDDLRVVPVFPSADRKAVIEVLTLESLHIRTVNEFAVQQGIEPMGFYLPRSEFNVANEADRQKFLKNPYNYPHAPDFVKIQKFVAGLSAGEPADTGDAVQGSIHGTVSSGEETP